MKIGALVQYGLEMLGHTQRIGSQEMLDMADCCRMKGQKKRLFSDLFSRLNALGAFG